MSDTRIVKELYKLTKDKVFTVEDLREHGLHNRFRHKNQIGSFFHWMNAVGYTKAMGVGRATHDAANSRWVWRWRWTEKAHEEFKESPFKGQLTLGALYPHVQSQPRG